MCRFINIAAIFTNGFLIGFDSIWSRSYLKGSLIGQIIITAVFIVKKKASK